MLIDSLRIYVLGDPTFDSGHTSPTDALIPLIETELCIFNIGTNKWHENS